MSALLPVFARDLVIVKGKGTTLYDRDGNRYLDFCAGIAVNGLGYGDRRVVAAIREQAAKLIHASNLYHTEPVMQLAERLVALTFPSQVFFTNSGTEAIEAAIKWARRIGRPSGRSEIVAFEGSFHGRTLGALSITWTAAYREPFEPLLPDTRFTPWQDLAALKAAVGPKTAAIIIEPVQGESGVRPASPEFLRGVAEIAREAGALLILDEIQTGFARTGRLFAYQHADVLPDILTLAKPLGGGLPLGAVLLRKELCDKIQVGDHGSTFGGNPVAAAASLAVLDALAAPGFVESVAAKGALLRQGLTRLARRYPQVEEVRGLGLMMGVVLKGPAAPVVAALRQRGILATRAGERVLRMLPPLIIKPTDIRRFLRALDAVFASGAGSAE
ncbi:MAG: acetylornithine/succinylornithine family transaminase [Vicinamibacteria bacterium]|jgi:predicted acetylornithine/succinylornithine family transaminase|nr:acetylornithine/succinylornithine family transaminase [Vicinamibacteria bacterium]